MKKNVSECAKLNGSRSVLSPAPSDYTATSVNVVLVPGSTQITVNVPVEDDTVQEDTESFLVRLSVPEGSQVVLGNDIATVTITDDDCE